MKNKHLNKVPYIIIRLLTMLCNKDSIEKKAHHNNLISYYKHTYVSVELDQDNANKISECTINESFDFELWHVFLLYLDMHDIFKLFTVCKTLRGYLSANPIKLKFNLDSFLLDAHENYCRHCIGSFGTNSRVERKLFLSMCKQLNVNLVLEHCKFKNIITDTNYVSKCIFYAVKRNYSEKKILFGYISNFNVKYNLKDLKILCEEYNREIIVRLSQHMRGPFTEEDTRFLLPLYCKADLTKLVRSIFGRLASVSLGKRRENEIFQDLMFEFNNTNENYAFLLDLIKTNMKNYSWHIVSALLHGIVTTQNINSNDELFICKLASNYADKKTIEHLLCIIRDPNYKIHLVPRAYKFNLEDELDFLNDSEEWNMVSVREWSKKDNIHNSKIFIDKLSEDKLLQIILDTEDVYNKKYLIKKIKKISNNSSKIKEIIDWAINTKNIECIYHFIYFKNLDISLRFRMLSSFHSNNFFPTYYKHIPLEDPNKNTIYLPDEILQNCGIDPYVFKLIYGSDIIFNFSEGKLVLSDAEFEKICKYIFNSGHNKKDESIYFGAWSKLNQQLTIKDYIFYISGKINSGDINIFVSEDELKVKLECYSERLLSFCNNRKNILILAKIITETISKEKELFMKIISRLPNYIVNSNNSNVILNKEYIKEEIFESLVEKYYGVFLFKENYRRGTLKLYDLLDTYLKGENLSYIFNIVVQTTIIEIINTNLIVKIMNLCEFDIRNIFPNSLSSSDNNILTIFYDIKSFHHILNDNTFNSFSYYDKNAILVSYLINDELKKHSTK